MSTKETLSKINAFRDARNWRKAHNEKDLALYESLTNSGHASPTEHIAKAMTEEEHNSYVKGKASNKGTDLMPMWVLPNEAKGWCRNYRGFIMYRELLD